MQLRVKEHEVITLVRSVTSRRLHPFAKIDDSLPSLCSFSVPMYKNDQKFRLYTILKNLLGATKTLIFDAAGTVN